MPSTRVLSVAALRQHLQVSGHGERIAVYLAKLCATLAASMIGDTRPVALETKVSGGMVVSKRGVSIGLIVIESVINALKHAFPTSKPDGRIVVSSDHDDAGWAGLGTSIAQALAKELHASLEFVSGCHGTTVLIKHATEAAAYTEH